MALRSGLCSVSFRRLPPEEVIDLAAEAGLDGIEWGGDVHLPPGELEQADRLARRCAGVGLATPSYGSYLTAGEFDQPVTAVFDTAATLGATTVRVWAGRVAPSHADTMTRQRVAGHLASLVDQAARQGLTVAVEFHEGTLTEDAASTLELFADTADERLLTYWQPRGGAPADESLAELEAVGHRLAHLHVFWWDAAHRRLPLTEGNGLWRAALRLAAERPRAESRFAFLEFVAGDDPAALRRDAEVLHQHLDRLEPDTD